MRTTRFSCSESQLCGIAGVTFEQLTPEQKNKARTLAMYFSTPETYHANILNEIRPMASEISLTVGDAAQLQGVTYYPISSANSITPVPTKPSITEMTEKLASRLNLPIAIIESWEDTHIEIAFVNLGLMPRNRTDVKALGYLLVDANEEYPRFKASAGSVDYVVKQYTEYVEQQRTKLAATPD